MSKISRQTQNKHETFSPKMSKIILGFKRRFTPAFSTHVQELVSSDTPPGPDHPANFELSKKHKTHVSVRTKAILF